MNEIENALGLNDKPSTETTETKPVQFRAGLGDNAAESVVTFVAYLTLILGIFGSLIWGVILMDHRATYATGWFVLIGGTLSSFITWAFLIVIANISNNIRQIKHELRNRKTEQKF